MDYKKLKEFSVTPEQAMLCDAMVETNGKLRAAAKLLEKSHSTMAKLLGKSNSTSSVTQKRLIEMLEIKSSLKTQIGGNHYSKLKIQPVQYIHANNIPFIEGSIIKYATRWRDKGGIKDLEKIIHFTNLLIELESSLTSKTENP